MKAICLRSQKGWTTGGPVSTIIALLAHVTMWSFLSDKGFLHLQISSHFPQIRRTDIIPEYSSHAFVGIDLV